jgi:hypothetical protein
MAVTPKSKSSFTFATREILLAIPGGAVKKEE